MADFMIRFLICNVFISGIIGILLIAKRIFKGNLSSRMQYNLWFLLLGLLVVPFIPFRLIGFPQILSWLSSLKSSPTSGTRTAIGEAVGINPAGNADWMNDFALSVNSETPSSIGYILFLFLQFLDLSKRLVFCQFHKQFLCLSLTVLVYPLVNRCL